MSRRRASTTMKIAAARKKRPRSTVIEVLAGVASVSGQNRRQDKSEEAAVLRVEVRDVLTPRPGQGRQRDGAVDPAEEQASARHGRSYHGSGRRVNRRPTAAVAVPSRVGCSARIAFEGGHPFG